MVSFPKICLIKCLTSEAYFTSLAFCQLGFHHSLKYAITLLPMARGSRTPSLMTCDPNSKNIFFTRNLSFNLLCFSQETVLISASSIKPCRSASKTLIKKQKGNFLTQLSPPRWLQEYSAEQSRETIYLYRPVQSSTKKHLTMYKSTFEQSLPLIRSVHTPHGLFVCVQTTCSTKSYTEDDTCPARCPTNSSVAGSANAQVWGELDE